MNQPVIATVDEHTKRISALEHEIGRLGEQVEILKRLLIGDDQPRLATEVNREDWTVRDP